MPMKIGLGRLALALLSLPLLGMGALGGGGNGTPERNYPAIFVDRDGTRVEASWVSAGGELAIAGELGRGSLRVAFEDIKSIEFAAEQKEPITAKVILREGKPVDIKVRSSLSFAGRTEVGQYKVRARDLRSIEFTGDSPPR